jgi:guanylate kinase
MPAQLFVVSGPSGAGKSTLIARVRKHFPDLGYTVSHTSRKPRLNEEDGKDYHFVDRETFQKMIEEKAFAEWAPVYDDYYGTSYAELDRHLKQGLDVILDIDVQGAGNIKKTYEQAVLIFILPPSPEILEDRLRKRATDHETTIAKRLEQSIREIKNCVWYDFLIVNQDLDDASARLEAIILAQRSRSFRMIDKVKTLFPVEDPS